jgi:hypothetical protein
LAALIRGRLLEHYDYSDRFVTNKSQILSSTLEMIGRAQLSAVYRSIIPHIALMIDI